MSDSNHFGSHNTKKLALDICEEKIEKNITKVQVANKIAAYDVDGEIPEEHLQPIREKYGEKVQRYRDAKDRIEQRNTGSKNSVKESTSGLTASTSDNNSNLKESYMNWRIDDNKKQTEKYSKNPNSLANNLAEHYATLPYSIPDTSNTPKTSTIPEAKFPIPLTHLPSNFEVQVKPSSTATPFEVYKVKTLVEKYSPSTDEKYSKANVLAEKYLPSTDKAKAKALIKQYEQYL